MTLTRRRLCLGLAALALNAARAAPAEVNVARFDPHPADAGPAFAAALAELHKAGGGRLVAPPGVYTFAATGGPVLRFAGLKDIEVVGFGAELVFRGLARPLAFADCRGVAVRGLTISWARAPFSQGELLNQAADRKSFEIALDAATPMDGWTRVATLGGYERESGLMTRRALDVYNVGESVEPLGPRQARVRLRWPVDLTGARTLLLRHAIYEAHALTADRCQDVAFEDVTVLGAPGMAFVGGLCRNVRLTRCTVAPRPGSELFMSTTADGAHFSDCAGELAVEGCRFSRMGDDGLNVNSSYFRVVERPDARTLVIANRGDAPFRGEDLPETGDLFTIADASTLETRGADALTGATLAGDPPRRERLAFARDLPLGAAPSDLIYDGARVPRLVVRGCLFEGNRARGVLAHAHATIEDCRFQDQTLAGILLSPSAFWLEGPEAFDVHIRNNVFDGCDRWGTEQGAIRVDAEVSDDKGMTRSSVGRPNHDIEVDANTFRNLTGPKIVLRADR